MSAGGIVLDRSLARLTIVAFNGKVADVAGASVEQGAPVLLWQPNGGENQHWTIRPAGTPAAPDAKHIANVLSGRVLDVSGNPDATNAKGKPLCQWPITDAPNQLWQLVRADGQPWVPGYAGQFTIHSLIDPSLVVDVKYGSDELILWTAHGGPNQGFSTSPV